jgi:two-component system sensor histidine kinase YesM
VDEIKRLLDCIGHISLRMYIAILLCLVIPLFIIFGYVRTKYEIYIQEELSEQIVISISKSEEVIYDSFRNIAGISSAIVTNNTLIEGLSNPDNSYYFVNKLFDACVNYTQVNNLYNNGEMLMTLFDRQGRCYTNWERNFQDYNYIREEDWVVEAEHGKGHLVWNLFSTMFSADKTKKYISVARAVYNGTIEEEPLGVLIVSMPQSHLSQVLKGFCYGEKDSVYVMGDGDKPIIKYEPKEQIGQLEKALSMMPDNKSGSFTMNTGTGTKLVSYYTLDAPWTLGEESLRIAHFTDFDYVLQNMARFSKQINTILTIAAISTLAVVGVIVRMLVKPVRKLSHVMRHYKLGDSLEGLDMKRQDEIGYLNRSFKRLTVNIKNLFDNLNKEYRIKERYRYESLRSQLNPHFLFNALNTIRYISIIQHADTITEGIDALAAVLKYSVGNGEKMTRLSDEIDHVRGYLEIQNMRFGQRIHLEEDFEPEIMAQYMPRFILQPIVENAVIHAFGENIRNEKECLIRLYGFNENKVFHLYVEDNGEGVSMEMLEVLNDDMHNNSKGKMTGIGFSHVKELIEMTFGKEYTLEITSHPGIGTVVHYKLPVIDKVEEDIFEKDFDSR